MFASVTTGHTAREIRSTRVVMRNNGQGPEQSKVRQIIKVRPARANTRRDAIRESLGSTR